MFFSCSTFRAAALKRLISKKNFAAGVFTLWWKYICSEQKNALMSIIRLPIRLQGSKGEKILYALFDSGANLSCIHQEHAAEIATLEAFLNPRRLATASEHHFMEITHRIIVDFFLNDVQLSDEFLVVPGLSEEMIIGAATLQKWRIKLDFEHDTVFVDPKAAKLQLI